MVRLAANHFAFASDRAHRTPVIVARPIGIGDVIAVAAPPRLARINPRTDRHRLRGGNDQAVRSPERAVKKARIVSDGMHRGEDTGVDPLHLHQLAQASQAGIIFFRRKGQHAVALVETVLFWTIRHNRPQTRGHAMRTPKGPGVQDESAMGASRRAVPWNDAIVPAQNDHARSLGQHKS